MPSRLFVLCLVALTVALRSEEVAAHPHVWVEVRSELAFGSDGRVTAVRHAWSFDEAYSAFSVQGLDSNGDGRTTPDELKELAATNVSSLADFGYFTHLKVNGTKLPLDPPRNESMSYEGGRLTLRFEMPLKKPASGKLLGLEVYDPTFFVEFQTSGSGDAVRLDGAPAGCSVTVSRPKPPQATDAGKSLSENFFQSLTASSNFGASFASRAVVACP